MSDRNKTEFSRTYRAYRIGFLKGHKSKVSKLEAENKALRELVKHTAGRLCMRYPDIDAILKEIDDYFAGKDKADETKTI